MGVRRYGFGRIGIGVNSGGGGGGEDVDVDVDVDVNVDVSEVVSEEAVGVVSVAIVRGNKEGIGRC